MKKTLTVALCLLAAAAIAATYVDGVRQGDIDEGSIGNVRTDQSNVFAPGTTQSMDYASISNLAVHALFTLFGIDITQVVTNTPMLQTNGVWDAQGVVVSNVASPTADNHAATKGYVDGAAGVIPTLGQVTDSGNVATQSVALRGRWFSAGTNAGTEVFGSVYWGQFNQGQNLGTRTNTGSGSFIGGTVSHATGRQTQTGSSGFLHGDCGYNGYQEVSGSPGGVLFGQCTESTQKVDGARAMIFGNASAHSFARARGADTYLLGYLNNGASQESANTASGSIGGAYLNGAGRQYISGDGSFSWGGKLTNSHDYASVFGDGLASLEDNAGHWVRIRVVDYILPYSSNGAYIGSQTLPFKEVHASNFNVVGSSVSFNGVEKITENPDGSLQFSGGITDTNGTAYVSSNDLSGVSVRVTALEGQTNNWNAAYGWGNHSAAGYASTGSVNTVSARVTALEAGTNNWNTAYAWGNHAIAGYAGTSAVNAVSARVDALEGSTGIWNTAYSTALSNTGRIAAIEGGTNSWNMAYSWGDHATAGYASTTSVVNVSNRVETLEGGTNAWNAAAAGYKNNALQTNIVRSFTLTIQDPTNGIAYFMANPFGTRSCTIAEVYAKSHGMTGRVDIVSQHRSQGWYSYNTVEAGVAANATGTADSTFSGSAAVTNGMRIGFVPSAISGFVWTNLLSVDFQITCP